MPVFRMSSLTAAVLASAAVAAPMAGADASTAPADLVPPPAAPLVIAPPSQAAGATLARVVSPTVARPSLDRPAGRSRRVRTSTSWSKQAQTLLVLDAATRDGVEYVKVLMAQRPNGSSGWVRRDRVRLSTTPYWVEVRLRARTVTVYRHGRQVLKTRAVVGKPGTPTPVGLSAIYERNRQPNRHGFLGPWALSLTSLSNVLESYGGGPGRVAIHGRDGASYADPLGTARSHGCIRINNRPVSWMARHLLTGTPVDVVDG